MVLTLLSNGVKVEWRIQLWQDRNLWPEQELVFPTYLKATHNISHFILYTIPSEITYTHHPVLDSFLNGASHRQADPFVRLESARVQWGQPLSRPCMVVMGHSAVSSSVSTRTRPTSCAACSVEVSFVRYVTMLPVTVAACSCHLWPRSGELQMQKLKSHLLRRQSWKVLPLKPGVGQYTAME